VLKLQIPSLDAKFQFILVSNFTAQESRIFIEITEKSAANAISYMNRCIVLFQSYQYQSLKPLNLPLTHLPSKKCMNVKLIRWIITVC
jgi:hypothetical protein